MHTFWLENDLHGYCLWKERRVKEKELPSFGTEWDARQIVFVRYVISLYMVHIHMIAIYLLQDHTEEKSDLMTRNLKGKTPLNGVLYTFNDTTIYLCIKSSERDVPSFPATGMTSQGMPDNFTVCQ